MFRRIKAIHHNLRWRQHYSTNQNHFSQTHASSSSSSHPNFTFADSPHSQDSSNTNFHQEFKQIPQPIETPTLPLASDSDDDRKENSKEEIDSCSQEDVATAESEKDRNQLEEKDFDYDVAVIGGGSGGLAFTLEAHRLGLKTVIFDFVHPTARGTRWGIGGTCVNVGCIPKKLFHTASMIHDSFKKQTDFGFGESKPTFELSGSSLSSENPLHLPFRWKQLVSNIQNYISDLNMGFEAQLINRNIPYINALATISDPHTIHYSKDKSAIQSAVQTQDFLTNNELKSNKIRAKYIVIAVGGRPSFLKSCENSEALSISSDDLFSLSKPPGKTLVVGGGYVALESAGFLSNLGFDTTVMTRGSYLKDFDEDVVAMILEDMKTFSNVKFIDTSLPYRIHKNERSQKLEVCFKNVSPRATSASESCDIYDTVLQAIGRTPNTSILNLEHLRVSTNLASKKIQGGTNQQDFERTSVENIYAIGDVLEGVPELTPPAMMAGRKLAHRISGLIKGRSLKELQSHTMDYKSIPTTVFTPLEYSCVGLNEKEAIAKHGEENIEVYHSRFTPLEDQLTFKYDETYNRIKRKGYCKVICKRGSEEIVGMHYFGPNAGEVMQGYAVAFRIGITKAMLDATVGIHPTCAEELLGLSITKRSGDNYDKDTC